MTPGERERELLALGWLEVPFDLIHGRIEALVGRPVLTHELGTGGLKRLAAEARGEREHPTFTETLESLPPTMIVIHLAIGESDEPAV
jgi:hypothetical protein